MTDLRQLLHRVFDSEHARHVEGNTTVYSRWMMEATNRIERLENKVSSMGTVGFASQKEEDNAMNEALDNHA